MKTILLPAVCLFPLVAPGAPFQNLGFDTPSFPDFIPNPIPGPPFQSTFGEWMVPGWSSGPNQQSAVGYNYTQPFWGASSLLDANYRNTRQPANPTKAPVVGNYSLGIWPDSGSRYDEFPFILSQTGDIPTDAQSLRFLYHGNALTVSIGGVDTWVHFIEDRPTGDPDVPVFHYFAVDVSAFAGQTAELRFEFRSFGNYPGNPSGRVPGWPDAKMHVLDDLSFSPLPAVPEPQTWALFGVGLGALLWRQRRRS